MDIAIIGLSLKLPNNINNLDELYNILKNKIDCIVEHPSERFDKESYYGDSKGKINTLRSGYIKDVYMFDNTFFKFIKKEADTMDPQQKIMLELTYEALQDSKYSLEDIKNSKTGVFIGSCNTEYFSKQSEDPDYCTEYSITGGLLTLLSNRISYFYDLKGPSMTIDTACSSSGHALHLACESIKRGESEMCIVGGSNLILNPETTVAFSQGKFLSPDGKCKTFDESANGYVRSEGCVILIIKKLSKAIEDGDKIYSIIKNTCINQDGKTSSITVPNSDAQKELMNECLNTIDINNLIYVEAHGTGTKLGDKIETTSIGESYGVKKESKLNIGSIKTNIGHTEATSGLASICKLIVMMQNKKLLPNINFKEHSKDIEFDKLNLNIVKDIINIEEDNYYMGLNNYGFGGANFHCILQNYDNNNEFYENDLQNNLHMLCVYGNAEESINKNVSKFLEYENDIFLKYLYNQNYTDKLDNAKIYIVEDDKCLKEQIFNPDKINDLNCIYGKFNNNSKPKICFVFCGQGPQFIDMGIDLMKSFPVFKRNIIKCDEIWKDIAGFSFIETYGMFNKSFTNNTEYDINDPIIAQPALAFFQISLIELYKYFGINPDMVIGHSAGEQASFYCSGGISLKDAIIISYYRSINQQKTAGTGNMLVINNNIDLIDELLEQSSKLELAAINSENSFVLSGPTKYIDGLQNKLTKKNIMSIKIRGKCPFHSSYQDKIKDNIISSTKHIKFNNPVIELISTVTGYTFDKDDYEPDYWWNNIRDKVNFYEGIEQCSEADIFVEISPHIVLSSYINSINKDALILNSANRKENSSRRFLSTLSKLYFSGCDINFEHFGISNNKYIPKYIWNKSKSYQEPESSINRRHNIIKNYSIIKNSVNKYDYVKDHIISKKSIVPTVYYIDMIIKYILGDNNIIKNLEIKKMYDLEEYISFKIYKKNDCSYNFLDKNDNELVNFEVDNIELNKNVSYKDYKKYIQENKENLNHKDISFILKNKNYNFGNKFKLFNKSYCIDNDTILIELLDYNISQYKIYPPALDICLTSGIIIQGLTNNNLFIPNKVKNMKIYNYNKAKYVYTNRLFEIDKNVITNSVLLDKDFNIICELNGCKFNNLNKNTTNIYTINNKELVLSSNKNTSDVSIIDNIDLIDIRDVLLENKNIIYLLNISEKYEVVGFIRSLINEIKTVNFKVCYFKKYENKLEEIVKNNKLENIEYFYDNGTLSQIKLNKYKSTNVKTDNYYLTIDTKGTVDNLYFKNKNLRQLNDGEVLIDVKASALNFKDIAVILNIVEDNNIGCEFSGIVKESKSKNFNIGDEVIGALPNKGCCITNSIISNEDYVWNKPKSLNFIESASVGLSYCTSYISLIKCAKITKDDIVLIHSATGALGLSCLEICKYIGCKVIVSAGNETKREYLKNNFNVELITDSRNYEIYKKDIMEYTKGKGVNVVISSTVGKSLQTNIEILSTYGRIVDLGKRHIYNNDCIYLKDFIKSIQYYSVHFDKLMVSDNYLIKESMREVINLIDSKDIGIFNINEYDILNYKDAFNSLLKSTQIGKITLKISDVKPKSEGLPDLIFNDELYYLITGGLGGLGVKLIDWMIKNGAKHFVLTTRKNNYDNSLIEKYKNKNIEINIVTTDLLDYNLLETVLNKYNIDGVFHLAGMIQDKMVAKIDRNDVNDVINVKKEGIKNLGKYFENKQHTYFVAFSSIVSLIGNPGQSTYSAGNSYMDEYCRIRNSNNLPALSINLGAIGGAGMISTNFNLAKIMKLNGIDFTIYYNFFSKLKECILDKTVYQVCITDQNWDNLNNLKTSYMYSDFIKNEKKVIKVDINKIKNKINKYLISKLDIKNIDDRVNLLEYGIDSIMSMELSNWISNQFDINIKQIDILQGISVNEILKMFKNINNTVNNDTNNLHKDLFYFQTKHISSNNEYKKVEIISDNNSNYSNYLIFSLFFAFLSIFYYYFI